MKNLWQKSLVCLALWGSGSMFSTTLRSHNAIAGAFLENDTPISESSLDRRQQTLLSQLAKQQSSFCESLGTDYQEYYDFETRNYNVSICRREEDWFYYRKSKSNPDSSLLLPATAVFGGDTFKAVDGKVTYFVGINSDGYYSSVMYGNNQMIFEPQLSRNSELSKREEIAPTTANFESDPESIEVSDSDLGLNYWNICTEDKNDVHPYLNGWQRFIGKSPNAISEYANIEGHRFQYSAATEGDAVVETRDGLMVTMNVLELTETISSVCVEPVTSF